MNPSVINPSVINRLRKVKGGKIEIQLAQVVDNPKARTNVVAILNASDERFKSGTPKARLAWMPVEPEELQKYFGIDVSTLTFDAKNCVTVEIINPTLNGEQLCIRLVDSLEPNYSKKPKMSVKGTGDTAVRTIFTYQGKPIYQATKIVGAKGLSHEIIERDGTMTGDQFDAYIAAMDAVSEDEHENADLSETEN